MSTTGDVQLTIADNGASVVSVAAATLQVVMGCSSAGTATSASATNILATRQASTIQSTFGYGPLVEAAAMVVEAGGSVLALRIPTTSAGAVAKKAAKVVSAASTATPIVITSSAAHGLVTGDVVTIAAVGGNTPANGTFVVTVLTSTTFSLNGSVGSGAYTSGGTITPLGAIQAGTGTAPCYFSGAAYDDFYILVTVLTGFTVGVDGGQISVSLDGGRQVNLPRVNVGTSSTYVIPQSNVTINFGTGTLVAGDTIRGYTTAPLWAVADVTAALAALSASPYADAGWGSMHLVGKIGGTDAGTVGTNMETLAADLLYDRLIGETRDASPPAAWGGTGETDSAWGASLLADFTSTTANRFGVSAGYYNMRSSYPNPVCGQPLFRRPLAWAWACRVVQLPLPADSEAWVELGALPQITLDAVNDFVDGFIYHNDKVSRVFDNLSGGAGRMTAARLRRKKPGWYISTPLTLATTGSKYQLMPYGRVIDIASDVLQQVLSPDISARIKLNRNGTIREGDALKIETNCYRALDVGLGSQISGRTVVVDRDYDVKNNSKLKLTGTILGDAFALEIDVSLGLA